MHVIEKCTRVKDWSCVSYAMELLLALLLRWSYLAICVVLLPFSCCQAQCIVLGQMLLLCISCRHLDRKTAINPGKHHHRAKNFINIIGNLSICREGWVEQRRTSPVQSNRFLLCKNTLDWLLIRHTRQYVASSNYSYDDCNVHSRNGSQGRDDLIIFVHSRCYTTIEHMYDPYASLWAGKIALGTHQLRRNWHSIASNRVFIWGKVVNANALATGGCTRTSALLTWHLASKIVRSTRCTTYAIVQRAGHNVFT